MGEPEATAVCPAVAVLVSSGQQIVDSLKAVKVADAVGGLIGKSPLVTGASEWEADLDGGLTAFELASVLDGGLRSLLTSFGFHSFGDTAGPPVARVA